MTLRTLTVAAAFTLAAGLALPAAASAKDRYARESYKGSYRSHGRGHGSHGHGHGHGHYKHGHGHYRPYSYYRPAPRYYYDPYVYGYAPAYRPYGYVPPPAPYYRHDHGPRIHLHLDF